MALYSYKAMTRDGMTRLGSLEASNEADLEKRLGNMKKLKSWTSINEALYGLASAVKDLQFVAI